MSQARRRSTWRLILAAVAGPPSLGRRRWIVGFLLPGDRQPRLHQINGGDVAELRKRIEHQRVQLDDPQARVVSCYEAGRHRRCGLSLNRHVLVAETSGWGGRRGRGRPGYSESLWIIIQSSGH